MVLQYGEGTFACVENIMCVKVVFLLEMLVHLSGKLEAIFGFLLQPNSYRFIHHISEGL